MDNLTAGLLFNDTMVMIAGSGDQQQRGKVEFAPFEYDIISPQGSTSSSSTSSRSSTSGCSPSYYTNTLQPELFTEFEFNGFELGSTQNPPLLGNSSDEERTYMEELISSDLSSDEDKFLETIRYGGGVVPGVEFGNDLLSEEELVNTIQNYGDVKVVQVESGVGEFEAVGEVVEEKVDPVVVLPVQKTGNKKRKSVVGGGGVGSKKRTVIIQSKKQPKVDPIDDDIIIETNSCSGSSVGSPSPGSPQLSKDGSFQELKLSEEEKRLLLKEGITLPTHYPLTKLEERELKRIRRKIRNKISAQDSRKRKKEFLDRLQQRVQEVEDEKSHLQKRVRSLETINSKLTAQVKRLQQALAQATTPTPASTPPKNPVVPAATTLLVLILSLALVVLPTSMDNNAQDNHSSNELISLLNRSNEMQQSGQRALLSDDKKFRPKSRAMMINDEDNENEERVVELLGEMKNVLMRFGSTGSRKRVGDNRGGGVWGNKRGRYAFSGDQSDWWVSDEEEDNTFHANVIHDNLDVD